MKTIAEQIRTEIEKSGGLMSFNSATRRNRDSARPMRFNLIDELQELEDSELNVAFVMGLFGNNGRKGTIVENACRYKIN
jgi:hypothetical protein